MALATHRPTVMVKVGLMEDARTISALSPVARMDRPSRVPRKSTSSAHTASTSSAVTASSYQLPAKPASPGQGVDGVHLEEGEVAGAHDHQVDAVQADVGDDAARMEGTPAGSGERP